MRPETSDFSYLWGMLDAACAIQEFVVGKTFNDYTRDRLLRGAVERHRRSRQKYLALVSRRSSRNPLEEDHRSAPRPRPRIRGSEA